MKRSTLFGASLVLIAGLVGTGLAAPRMAKTTKSGLAVGEQAGMFTFTSIHTGKSGCVT